MKDDVEIPAAPPRKRRELERALPAWLATWANDEHLPDADRRRAQKERDRRKALVPAVRVGVIVGEEGMTPAQREVVAAAMAPATELHVNVGQLKHLRRLLGAVEVDSMELHEGDHEVVRHATTIVAAPKEPEKPDRVEGVWEGVRYAKHRKVAVRVVLPNGEER